MFGFLAMMGLLWVIFRVVPSIVYGVIGRRWQRRIGRGVHRSYAGAARHWGRGHAGGWNQAEWSAGAARRDGGVEGERGMIEALETKVAELEARLDFTERLLAGRPAATLNS